MMRAIEKIPLEQLSFWSFLSDTFVMYHAFLDAVSRMKRLKELSVNIRFDDIFWFRREYFLQALRRNFSIQAVFAPGLEHNRKSKKALAELTERNARLAGWVKKPETLPRALWPHAMKMAMNAGEGTLFESLLAVFGEETLYAKEIADERLRTQITKVRTKNYFPHFLHHRASHPALRQTNDRAMRMLQCQHKKYPSL